MASPLSYLRKNQYMMLVAFGVLLMFAFVVAPPLQDWLQNRARAAGDPLVLKWAHGEVRRSDLERWRSLHYRTMNFVQGVQQLAIQNGGFPKANLTRLRRASSELELIQTMLLARKAEDQGLLINDEAISDYLMQLSDGTMRQSDTEKLLEESHITLTELYQRLREELLAENMDAMYMNATPVPTPAEVWKVHGRMARRVEAEILPISVASFRDQVDAKPTDSELRQLFEEGKSRYPNPDSPLPGFRIRERLRLAYVKADFNKFLEEARKTVTEEEIKERYQRGIERREYRRVLQDTRPATPKRQPPLEEFPRPASQPPVESFDNSQPPAAEGQPGPDPGADSSSAAGEESRSGESSPDENGSASLSPDDRSLRLVSALQEPSDDPPPADPPADPPAAAADPPAESPDKGAPQPPAETPAATSNAAPEAATEPAPDTPAGDTPAGDTPADGSPPGGQDAAGGGESPPQDVFKPLEEVREEIIDEIAMGRAQTKMDEALKPVEAQLQAFHRQRVQWESLSKVRVEAAGPEPTLDARALAEEHGLEYHETAEVDALSVADTELGKCYRLEGGAMFGPRRVPFVEDAFREGAMLYEPARANDPVGRVEFIYWRIGEQPERAPEFEEVKPEVTEAWITGQARQLARQQAEKLAAAAQDVDLKQAAGDRAEQVFVSEPFSWLTSNLPFASPSAAPRISEVEGVDQPGNEFMQKVFELKKDQAGFAFNRPETDVYVVKVLSESTVKELRDDFGADEPRTEMSLAARDRQDVYFRWIDGLFQEMDVSWSNQP